MIRKITHRLDKKSAQVVKQTECTMNEDAGLTQAQRALMIVAQLKSARDLFDESVRMLGHVGHPGELEVVRAEIVEATQRIGGAARMLRAWQAAGCTWPVATATD